ncbi:MAG: hypothetical protein FWE06_08570 [Oscillospiraceae bacterium]|nr:hypothetical protein [Oscillospiraceae bacterium]
MFKKSKLAISLALALIMCVGLFASVSAFDPADHPGTPANPARLGLTKILNTPIGTEIPSNMTFNFAITPVSLDGVPVGDPTWPTGITMPVLGTAGAVAISVNDARMTNSVTAPTTTTRIMETGDLLAGISWPTTGTFVWRVVELDNVNPHILNQDPEVLEAVDFSQAQFLIVAHVFEDPITGTRYVRFTYGYREYYDDGTPGSGKVPGEPGTLNPVGDHSQLFFTNRYTRRYDYTPDPELGPLTISKTVTGAMGSTTREFDFRATLDIDPMFTAPFTAPAAFTAYRIAADGTTVIGTVYTFARGVEQTFRLRHGERLVFQDTPVGTQFVVTETAVFSYATSILVNGVTIPGPAGLTTGLRYVLTGGSTAAFTNHREAPPMGINMSTLPFYGLILLAVGGFAVFVVVKVRKGRNYN